MGEKEIAPGGDGPKPDPRAGGGGQGGAGGQPGAGGQGQGGGQGGQGGQGGEGGGDAGKGGGWVDPPKPGPQPQQIITGPKKTNQPRPMQFPQPGQGGGRKRNG